jgi:hypothetical protein
VKQAGTGLFDEKHDDEQPAHPTVVVVYDAAGHGDQYESELITSPALIDPIAIQVDGLIEFLMK